LGASSTIYGKDQNCYPRRASCYPIGESSISLKKKFFLPSQIYHGLIMDFLVFEAELCPFNNYTFKQSHQIIRYSPFILYPFRKDKFAMGAKCRLRKQNKIEPNQRETSQICDGCKVQTKKTKQNSYLSL
jgi:hypothetical protein